MRGARERPPTNNRIPLEKMKLVHLTLGPVNGPEERSGGRGFRWARISGGGGVALGEPMRI